MHGSTTDIRHMMQEVWVCSGRMTMMQEVGVCSGGMTRGLGRGNEMQRQGVGVGEGNKRVASAGGWMVGWSVTLVMDG